MRGRLLIAILVTITSAATARPSASAASSGGRPAGAPVLDETGSLLATADPLGGTQLADGTSLGVDDPGFDVRGWSRSTLDQRDASHCATLDGVNDRCPAWAGQETSFCPTLAFDQAVGRDAVYLTGSKRFGTGCSERAMLTTAFDKSTGEELWVQEYRGVTLPGAADYGIAIAPSPDGSKLFVTGIENVNTRFRGMMTVAYDAATGEELWVASRAHGNGLAIVVSPDGSRVFVTGHDYHVDKTGREVIRTRTIAYDSGTGAEEWAATWAPPGGYGSGSYLALVDSTVYVMTWIVDDEELTNETIPTTGLLAYDDRDGHEGELRWSSELDVASDHEYVSVIGMSATEAGIWVAGTIFTWEEDACAWYDSDTYLLRHDLSSDGQKWLRRQTGPQGQRTVAYALATDRERDAAYVVGYHVRPVNGGTSCRSMGITSAYSLHTGETRWVSRAGDSDPTNTSVLFRAVAVAPDGWTVYSSGLEWTNVPGSRPPFVGATATHAFDATTGEEVWRARYQFLDDHAATWSDATLIATDPDGSRLFAAAVVATTLVPAVRMRIGTFAYDIGEPGSEMGRSARTPNRVALHANAVAENGTERPR